MRLVKPLLAISTLLFSNGCMALGALEALGGSCTQEQIVVTWQAAITRGGETSGALLASTVTDTNIDQTQFNRLRQALTSSTPNGTYDVTWTVSAFNVNGGYISFNHISPLTTGQTLPVVTTFNGGGWGAQQTSANISPSISVRADNFTATSSSGSITALAGSPLRLRIDVTAASASGETIRMTGDAGFAYQAVTVTCL